MRVGIRLPKFVSEKGFYLMTSSLNNDAIIAMTSQTVQILHMIFF